MTEDISKLIGELKIELAKPFEEQKETFFEFRILAQSFLFQNPD